MKKAVAIFTLLVFVMVATLSSCGAEKWASETEYEIIKQGTEGQ